MKILHYALGFPPYRSGGLTKFCVDLMVQQVNEKHIVGMLWPGQINFINKKVRIKKHSNVCIRECNIYSFEIINPLPISFDEGIINVSAFMLDTGLNSYAKFLDSYKPDVIHLHTLMGIHKSFLQAAKDRNIRLVFTAHDFFPICPKVTMFRHDSICNNVKSCLECGMCNTTALSFNKIRILQSPLYRVLKDSLIVMKSRKHHRDKYLSGEISDNFHKSVGSATDYKKLRWYYYSLLKQMDMIHYNSSVTKNVYETLFKLPNNCIINITHSNIKDNRVLKEFSGKKLRIRYLGPMSSAKGFFLLKNALDELWSKQQNFCLDVHFVPNDKPPYMKSHAKYMYSDLKKIFDNTDVLIAPSIWYETFGFTVLEALSYGVPVIISGSVGAKDILINGAGIVVNNISPKKLCKILQELTPEKLKVMNDIIIKKQTIMKIEEMSQQIENICYGWNNDKKIVLFN